MFETCIRVVGGILTAHELSGDEGFLRRYAEPLLCCHHMRTIAIVHSKANECMPCISSRTSNVVRVFNLGGMNSGKDRCEESGVTNSLPQSLSSGHVM